MSENRHRIFFLKKRSNADFTISRLLLGSGVDLGMRFVGLGLVFGVHPHPALIRAFLKGIVLAGLPELLELAEGAQGDASRKGFLGQRRGGGAGLEGRTAWRGLGAFHPRAIGGGVGIRGWSAATAASLSRTG